MCLKPVEKIDDKGKEKKHIQIGKLTSNLEDKTLYYMPASDVTRALGMRRLCSILRGTSYMSERRFRIIYFVCRPSILKR